MRVDNSDSIGLFGMNGDNDINTGGKKLQPWQAWWWWWKCWANADGHRNSNIDDRAADDFSHSWSVSTHSQSNLSCEPPLT